MVFVYHKKKKCKTLFYFLSPITYSTTHCRIFCRILSGYNREMWYIFEYGLILVKPYPFPYPSITSHIRDRIWQVSDRIRFSLPLAFGRSVGNNPFRFHPYLRSILSPAQKCESPGFHKTCDKAFEPTYFRLRSVCQTPSSVKNLKSHFLRRAIFLTSRSWIPVITQIFRLLINLSWTRNSSHFY
jgi:hypothetical protein